MRTSIAILVASLGCACGGPQATAARADAIDPPALLLEVGASTTELLRAPEQSIEALDAARGEARGPDRRRALRDLARAHLVAAEGAEDREARRHRRSAERFAENAAQGSRDSAFNAEMAFVQIWLAWRGGAASASGRAERFTTRFAEATSLAPIVWMIRGEIAFESQRWDEAATAFRFVLGQLGHPLYAYALYRTAACLAQQGREEDSRQALREVAQLGCDGGAPASTMQVALRAATELGAGARTDPEGVTRPASCPEETSTAAEGEERPPALSE